MSETAAAPGAPGLNPDEVSKLLTAGTTGPARALNVRLAVLAGCRWRPHAGGGGLQAIDRRGRVVASLLFQDGDD